MIWFHMVVLLGMVVAWLVMAMSMSIAMIFMDKNRGGSVGIVVVQRIIHSDHFIMVEGLLNVMNRGNKYFFLHHSLHHGHRLAIVGILDVTIVIIVLIVVVVIVNHRYSSCTRGDDQGLSSQLISKPLLLLFPQCSDSA